MGKRRGFEKADYGSDKSDSLMEVAKSKYNIWIFLLIDIQHEFKEWLKK